MQEAGYRLMGGNLELMTPLQEAAICEMYAVIIEAKNGKSRRGHRTYTTDELAKLNMSSHLMTEPAPEGMTWQTVTPIT
jgi:hypothetical protein